jgi:hypothetical protein
MDKEVTKYIEKQKSLQKEICKKLRQLILKTLPKLDERLKLGVPWYGKYYIVGLKDSVNLGFSIKGLSHEQIEEFSGTGKTTRHLKFKSLNEIDEKHIVKLLKLINTKTEECSCYK